MRRIVPAIVGAAQVVQRPGEVSLDQALGPIELMVEAARAAAADAGNAQLLGRVGFVGVAGGWFRYKNPGQLVASAIGSPAAGTALSAISGTGPQDLLGLAADRIARGELDVALIVGGEARWSHQKMKRQGAEPAWLTDPGAGVPETVSAFPDEMIAESIRLGGPPAAYALFEDRLRASAGRPVDEHRTRIAELWAAFSEVAATNPHAWDRRAYSAEEIRRPSPENRMIAFPYTKAMVANNTVDMATAVLLCSQDTAREHGLAPDRQVFPAVVTSAHETWLVAERRELDVLPALAGAARQAFTAVGIGIDQVDHIDLYACFPAIVEMSVATLGIAADRVVTLTGGLGFAGAPVGNAVGHSLCAMVDAVRGGGTALIHGNGGQATKHCIGIYTDRPPDHFARIDAQDSIDLAPRTPLPEDWAGPVTVEAATLVYGREGPAHILAAVCDSAGARGFAISRDNSHFDQLVAEGLTGMGGARTEDGTLKL